MEEKKNSSNVLTIILFVLLVIAVGVICYLLGSNNTNENNLNNDNNITEEKENNESESTITPFSYTPKCPQQENLMVDIDDTKYDSIVKYIQEQKNVKISIKYCETFEEEPMNFEEAIYELTDEEKNQVLNEIKSSVVDITASGVGGVCVPTLEINYERNNKQYYISYYQLFAMSSNDGNIFKITDKLVRNIATEEDITRFGCLYNFNNLSNTASSIENRLSSN